MTAISNGFLFFSVGTGPRACPGPRPVLKRRFGFVRLPARGKIDQKSQDHVICSLFLFERIQPDAAGNTAFASPHAPDDKGRPGL